MPIFLCPERNIFNLSSTYWGVRPGKFGPIGSSNEVEERKHFPIRRFESGKTAEAASPAHRLDDSPAGYSLAGWSPPEPASASPTEDDSGGEAV